MAAPAETDIDMLLTCLARHFRLLVVLGSVLLAACDKGPWNSPYSADEARLNIHRVDADVVRLSAGGQRTTVRRGEWSSWLPLKL